VWVRFALPACRSRECARGGVRRKAAGSRPRQDRGAYTSTLRALPTDPAAAQAAVAELEAASLPTGKVRVGDAGALGDGGREHGCGGEARCRPGPCPPPLRLQRSYSLRKSYLLEAHARRMIEELAVLYAEKDKSPQAKIMAANALATSAAACSSRARWSPRAHVPAGAGARPRQPRRAHRRGPHDGADRPVQARPDPPRAPRQGPPENSEARLRLAINVARVFSTGAPTTCCRSAPVRRTPSGWRGGVPGAASSLIQAERFEQAEGSSGRV